MNVSHTYHVIAIYTRSKWANVDGWGNIDGWEQTWEGGVAVVWRGVAPARQHHVLGEKQGKWSLSTARDRG